MPKKKSRARRPTKATASTASTAGSTTADGKLSVGWLEDSCGFEVKRKYKQGDALVQKSLRHHVGCLVCGSNEAVFQYRACGRCRTRSYCSQRCQKTDWHNFGHKQECGMRKKMIEEGQLPRVRRLNGTDAGPNGKLRTDVARAICEDVEASKVSGNAAMKEGRHNDAMGDYNWALRAGLASFRRAAADGDSELERRARRVTAIVAVNLSILCRRVAEAALTGKPPPQPVEGVGGSRDYADIALGLSLSYARESRAFDDTYALKSLEAERRASETIAAHFEEADRARYSAEGRALSVLPQHAAEHAELFKKLLASLRLMAKNQGPGSECVGLLTSEFMSVSSYYRLEAERFDTVLARGETSPFWTPKAPPASEGLVDGFGLASVTASLVPIRDGQWIAMSLRDIQGREIAMSLRCRCCDKHGDCDEISSDPDRGETWLEGHLGIGQTKSISHAGSDKAHRNAAVFLAEFFKDVRAKGIELLNLVLGAGLFDIHPERPGNEEFAAALPPVIQVHYAINHVMADARLGAAEALEGMSQMKLDF